MAQRTVTTIITPDPSSGALTSLRNVKDELNIGLNDFSQDRFLLRAIVQVSALVSSYCNRTLVAETIQDLIYPDLFASGTIYLSRSPVISVTSVVVTDWSGDVTTLVQDTDFQLDPLLGWLTGLDDFGLPCGWTSDTTTVVYQAGYSPIPADLEDVTLRMIASRFRARGRDPLLKSQETSNLGRQEYWVPNESAAAMPDDVCRVLDNYRFLSMASA